MKKPALLTFWLTLLAVVNIGILLFYTFSSGSYYITRIYPSFPISAWPVYTILTQLGGILLLWQWKKAGFPIVIATTLMAAVLSLAFLSNVAGIAKSIAFVAIVSIPITVVLYMLYRAMKPVWQEFQDSEIFIRRPMFLTIWLLGMIAASILLLALKTIGIMKTPSIWNDFPFLEVIFGYLLLICQLIGIALLWKGKKAGFYIILCVTVFGLALPGSFNNSDAWDTMTCGISLGLFFISAEPIWDTLT